MTARLSWAAAVNDELVSFAKILIGKNEKPDETPKEGDIWLNYERDYILPRFTIWVKSGYTVFPSGINGIDNQDALLVDDFFALLTRLTYHIHMLSD